MFANSGKVGDIVNPVTDPVSGQPQFKHTPVSIEPIISAWKGFILSDEEITNLPFAYWVRQKKQNMHRYNIEGDTVIRDWTGLAHNIFPGQGDWVEYYDETLGYYRAALIRDKRISSCIFIAQDDTLPDDQWLDSIFAETELQKVSRANLLSGQPPSDIKPAGKTVCACFNVGINTIIEAIQTKKLTTTEQIGEVLQAGTNCGSCLPELKETLQKINT